MFWGYFLASPFDDFETFPPSMHFWKVVHCKWVFPGFSAHRLSVANFRFDMASAGDPVTLKFAPLESVVDPAFWHCFSKAKLEVIRLDEKPVPLHGYFYNGNASPLPCRFSLDFSAFELWVFEKCCLPYFMFCCQWAQDWKKWHNHQLKNGEK